MTQQVVNISHGAQRSETLCDQDGFSLLELVVAVSIMLILGVVGFVAYQNYTDDARQAALDTSANQVLTAVIAEGNAPSGGDPVRAVASYNETADDIVVDIVAADADRLTVEAMRCDGETSRATVQGNHDHIDTTTFRDVQYSWTGTPGHSPSTKIVCGEPLVTNLTPYGRYDNPVETHWRSNNTLHLQYQKVPITDHPQGLEFARQSRLQGPGLDNGRIDFYSDRATAGMSRDDDYDYIGAWVWSSIPAQVEIGTRTYDRASRVELPANTWKFVVSHKGVGPGIYFYMRQQDRYDPQMRADAVGRVAGVIFTKGTPPTEFFDGDSTL